MGMPLIIKENMRLENGKNTALIHSAKQKCLVNNDIPTAKCCHDPCICRGTAGGDDGGPQEPFVIPVLCFPFIFQFPEFCQFCQ